MKGVPLRLPIFAAWLAAGSLWSGQATAQIALQDGSTALTYSAAATVSKSVTVTAGATVLVVLLEDHLVYDEEPATLSWNGATLTLAVQEDLEDTTYRGCAIYYCFNPPVGTATLSVTVPGADSTWLTAYTLNGTGMTAPLTGSIGADGTGDVITFGVAGVPAGSWAAVNATWANTSGGDPVLTGTGGTASIANDIEATPDSVMTAGYISDLAAGSDTFSGTWVGTAQKCNFAAAVFSTPAAVIPVAAWTGAASANWDTTTANWTLTPPGSAGDFANGDAVTFGDTGVAQFSVNVNAAVTPSSMSFNNSANNYTIGSTGGFSIGGSGGLSLTGTGTVTLNNKNTFTGGMTIGTGATLKLGGSGELDAGIYAGAISDGGVFVYNSSAAQTNSGVMSGSGALVVNGSGTLTLSALNTYTGGTTVNSGGTLALRNGGSTGCILGALTINPGGTVNAFTTDALGYTTGDCVTVITNIGGTFNDQSAGGNESYITQWYLTGGTIASPGGGAINMDTGYGFTTFATNVVSTISAPIYLRGTGLTFTTAQGTAPGGIDLLVSGIIANTGGGGNGVIVKAGPGTMELTGDNTFASGLTINAGTLIVGGTGLLAGGNFTGAIPNSGTLVVSSTGAQTLGGVISGTGSIQVAGSGAALTLTNVESYTGATTISGGTLYLTGAGSISNSPVITITNKGVFDASGVTGGIYTMGPSQNLVASNAAGAYAVNGSVVTGASSEIFPGGNGGIGTLTFNQGLTLAGGATVNFDVSTTYNGANDQIMVTGALALNGNSFHLKAPSTGSSLDSSGNDYVLMTVGGGVSGSFNPVPFFDVAPINASDYTIVTESAKVVLHYNASNTPTLPVVTNLAATSVTYASASLNGQLTTAGNPLPYVIIYYGTNDGAMNAAAWGTNVSLGLQSGTFGATISNLSPNTTYYFAAAASNSVGTVWAQPSKSFSTPAAKLAVVTNLPAANVQGNSAILNGQVVSIGSQIPTVALYYGLTDGGTNAAAWANNIYLGQQSGSFAVTVTGLSTNTTYYYAVGATNVAGAAWAQPSLAFTTLPTAAVVSVLTYHNDNARTGANTNETLLTPATVNVNNFGRLMTYAVDGFVFAQPLYVANLAIPGQGTHNVVFVATENDTVYAFDADSNVGANGGLLWSTNLGIAPLSDNGEFGGRYHNGVYIDLTPEVGITGTPVIDPVSGTLYVDALTRAVSATATNYYHRIHALNITNGAEESYSPVTVSATVPGTGVGGNGTVVTFNPQQEGQRPALTLAGGHLYVAYGSFADTDPYHGWVMGFNATNLQPLANSVFNTTPNATTAVFGANAGEGAIWMGGNGLSVDANTNLYFETANGSFSANTNGGDYGDSFVKLSTSNQLAVADYFTPSNQAAMQTADSDLGSGGPLLLPDAVGSAAHPHLIVGGGKAGIIFLVDRDNMGTYVSATAADRDVEEVDSGMNFFSSPAYFNYQLYYQGRGNVMNAYVITNGNIAPTPASVSGTSFAGYGTTPSVSANGTSNGIVWSIQTDGTTPSDAGQGVLHALNATNVAVELYNSSQNAARDNPGGGVKYAVPTIANGKVYVGAQYALSVYGYTTFLATPAISPNGEAFTNSVQVTLSDATPGAAIYYTEDGTAPTTNSILYAGPFAVTTTLNLQAIAIKTGAANSGVASASFVNTAALGYGIGLLGEYWTNTSSAVFTNAGFSTAATLTRTDAVVNFNWSSTGPDPSIGQTNFTARWIGCVQPQYSETYTLTTITHDGVRLWVNGQLLINSWTTQTAAITNTATVAFSAQQLYNIQMDYFQNTGAAVAQLLWSGPSTALAVIPQTQLYPYTNPPPTIVLSSPAGGASYTAAASVTLGANADAPYNPITNVVFYTNGGAAGILRSSPDAPYYTLTATGLAAGNYTLTAVATDGSGLSGASMPVNITVNASSGIPYGLTTNAPLAAFLNSNMPPVYTGSLPPLLSETGAFSDTPNRVPSAGLIPYAPNTPLWSDSAVKSRYLGVPNGGAPITPAQQIGFAPTGSWTFPAGTVFVKNFDLVVNQTNPAVPVLRLETRLLVRDTNGAVYGVTYKWRADNSDADLLGSSLTEAVLVTNATGVVTQNWYYPSPADCLTCHTKVAGYVLGVNTRQLNGTNTYPATGVTDNQLRTLNRLGEFNPAFDEAGISNFEQLASVTNPNAPLVQRARSYLDANCAQCHQPGGTGITFDARYDTPLQNQEITNYPASFSLGVDNAKIIAPSDIWRSVLYARMNTVDPAIKMPTLARNTIDSNAVAALAGWINSLGGTPALAPPVLTPASGIFTNAVTLTLQPPDPNAALYYTLDGTLPTTNSTLYEGPVNLTSTATFTANAFETNYVNSVAVTGGYTIVPPLNNFFAPGFLANGSFQMQYWATAGQTYILQASTDLVNWISVATNAPVSAPFNWVDPGAGSLPHRFYRVVPP